MYEEACVRVAQLRKTVEGIDLIDLRKRCFERATSRVADTMRRSRDYFKSGNCMRGNALFCSNGCEEKNYLDNFSQLENSKIQKSKNSKIHNNTFNIQIGNIDSSNSADLEEYFKGIILGDSDAKNNTFKFTFS